MNCLVVPTSVARTKFWVMQPVQPTLVPTHKMTKISAVPHLAMELAVTGAGHLLRSRTIILALALSSSLAIVLHERATSTMGSTLVMHVMVAKRSRLFTVARSTRSATRAIRKMIWDTISALSPMTATTRSIKNLPSQKHKRPSTSRSKKVIRSRPAMLSGYYLRMVQKQVH